MAASTLAPISPLISREATSDAPSANGLTRCIARIRLDHGAQLLQGDLHAGGSDRIDRIAHALQHAGEVQAHVLHRTDHFRTIGVSCIQAINDQGTRGLPKNARRCRSAGGSESA